MCEKEICSLENRHNFLVFFRLTEAKARLVQSVSFARGEDRKLAARACLFLPRGLDLCVRQHGRNNSLRAGKY